MKALQPDTQQPDIAPVLGLTEIQEHLLRILTLEGTGVLLHFTY